MKRLIKTFLFSSFIFSQYPADSLLSLPNNSIAQKIFLYPIAKWQGISYGNSSMNCQFFPSCSNYGAQAINKKGVVFGLAIASDRIIRCNHTAYNAHNEMCGEFNKDRRLIDHVNYTVLNKSKKSPLIAAGLALAIPGLGRAYAGRPKDAVFGFLMSALAINAGIRSIKKENFLSPLYIGVALTFYSGEVYGAYRTAKYYQPRIKE
jgi:putative component of membrane protein insertase Oxa1/YidC/SpoIIIJ protein YidD